MKDPKVPFPNLYHERRYTEAQAARVLGISVARIRALLDEYVFVDGSKRTSGIEFTSRDLLLLGFWHHSLPKRKSGRLLQMPRPKK